MLVYNVHNLIHLVDDVKKIGPLDTFSAYSFKSFLGMLKKGVRKPSQPLQLVVGENTAVPCKLITYTIFTKYRHTSGPLPLLFSTFAQLHYVKYSNVFYLLKDDDS